VSISGRRLTRTLAGNRTETEFGSDGDVLAAYKDLFGHPASAERVPESGDGWA